MKTTRSISLVFRLAFLSVVAIFCVSLVTITPTQAAAANGEDVVLQWNRVTWAVFALPGLHPPTVFNGRTTSMVHLAMFDAINSIDGSSTPYLTEVPGSKHASQRAAAAQAAHDVLTALYPSRQSVFDDELAVSLAGIEENRARQGQVVGSIVAANMLANRADDNWSATPPDFLLPLDPGNWQRTPPAFAAPAFTHFAAVKPFFTTGSSQFRPNPPPALSSPQYAADLNETKTIGAKIGSPRTDEQTLIALIWQSGPASGITWNNVARDAAMAQGNSLIENARLFALLSGTYHDTLQTTFTSKYHYGLWRPIDAIRRADEDGNADTAAEVAWDSLFPSPPYPTYAGNAAGHGTSQAATLALFFGRDDIPLTVSFTGPPAAVRSYPGFTAVANEQARSRIYGGIHFQFDSEAGQSVGRNIANYAFTNFLTPRAHKANGGQ